MDDYPGLAARVAAGVGGVRGCLILSRHGLVLGAYPDGDESVVKPSWLRFAVLGEPERAFIEFADQTWVYVHRGPYSAFALADAGVRPGLLMEQLDQALLTAEESRSRREGLRTPDAVATSAPRPRTALHPPAAAAVADVPVILPVAAAVQRPTTSVPEADGEEPSRPEPPSPAPDPASWDANEEAEVDKVMLAQEFGGLLQELRPDDEATS